MFVNDKIIYLELHKTGCTHIRNKLQQYLGGEFVGKHNQIPEDWLEKERRIIGSIRSPWDWYISLWSFGCGRNGSIYNHVTKGKFRCAGAGWKEDRLNAAVRVVKTSNLYKKKWRRLYANPQDTGAFREWMHLINEETSLFAMGEAGDIGRLGNIAGLMTIRYLKLFCTVQNSTLNANSFLDYDEIKNFEKKACLVNQFIRNENLNVDLLSVLENAGSSITDQIRNEILASEKTNQSVRMHELEKYYDTHTSQLVSSRDKLIVDKFKYSPPPIQ